MKEIPMNTMRKNYSAGLKYKIAVEALKEQESLASLSQKHAVHPSQVQKWKTHLQKSGASIFEDKRSKSAKQHEKIISQLHEKIGKLTVERDFLEGALSR